MATKRTASKTSKKATVDFDFNVEKPGKRKINKAKKQIKKLGTTCLILAVVFLVVGAVGGFFGVKYIARNDCFVILGQDEITLEIGENYLDEGVKVIAFGKDDGSKVEIETDLTLNSDGTYTAKEVGTHYIKYKVKNLKYGSVIKVERIRLINFVEASEGDNYEE